MRKFISSYGKRAGLTLMTIAIVVAGAAAFSAFEGHIVNVTARIENAIGVSTEEIEFGTVFPQEYLTFDVNVGLSESFLDEDRVDDVEYVIKQKPKVKLFCPDVVEDVTAAGTLFGLINVAQAQDEPCEDPFFNPVPGDPYATITVAEDEFTGPAWEYCEENLPEDIDPSTPQYNVDRGDVYWDYCYLPLSNYLSKHKHFTESPENEVRQVNAFHQSYVWDTETGESSLTEAGIAVGRLAKSEQDLEDTWVIDLAVPCFVGHCAQDWVDFVAEHNPTADAAAFMLDPVTEHLMFGTDLWIEVTGVSEAPTTERPEVGANLSTYVAPTTEECDSVVTTTIQAAVDAAAPGDTVCVPAGTYAETVTVNKSLTLAGASPVGSSVITGGVVVEADDVTVKGFEVNPAPIGLGPTVASFFLMTGSDNVTLRDNDVDGSGVSNVSGTRGIIVAAGGTFANVLIENNEIHDFTSGIYLEYQPAGTPFTIRLNDIEVDNPADNGAGASAGIGALGGAVVTLNEFTGELANLEAIGVVDPYYGGQAIEFNNFLNGSMINDYGTTPVIDAENNFFGPNGGAVQAPGADTDPEEVSAFPHN